MGNLQLQQLVREYSDGLIAREIYLVRRKQLIDRAVEDEPAPITIPGVQPKISEPAFEPEPALGFVTSMSPQQLVFSVAFSLIVVLIIGLIMVEIVSDGETGKAPATAEFVQTEEALIESLVHQLNTSSEWRTEALNRWREHWLQLDDAKQLEFKQTALWQNFERQVINRSSRQQALADSGDTFAMEQVEQLHVIAKAADITLPTMVAAHEPQEILPDDPEVAVLVANAAAHSLETTRQNVLANSATMADAGAASAQESARASNKSNPSSGFNEPMSDQPVLDQPSLDQPSLDEPVLDLAAFRKPALSEPEIAQVPGNVEKPVKDSAKATQKATSITPNVVAKRESKKSTNVPDNVWADKSNATLQQFSTAMQKGDINTLVNLFVDDGVFLKVKSKPYIKRTLTNIISTTQHRTLSLNVNQWKRDEGIVSGVGRYRLESRKLDAEEDQIVSADLRVKLLFGTTNDRNNAPRIVSFEVVNKDVISIPINVQNNAGSKHVPPLTNSDMEKLMSRFVGYYEKGDLEGLISLFSVNVETNDQSTIGGVKEDYQSLFDATRSRQLYIKNMQWKINGNTADGQGLFVILVVPNKSSEEQTLKGGLKMTVGNNKNGVFISRLFHELD